MTAPDPAWIPFLKVLFGFLLVVTLAILACIIALGHVEAATSFGLDIILGGLMVLAGGFAQWAFRVPNDKENKE